MEAVINNQDLFRHIMTFLPLTDSEIHSRRQVVLELKYRFCEWSEHKKYCYICKPYHPLVINKTRKYMCRDCCRIFRLYMSTRI